VHWALLPLRAALWRQIAGTAFAALPPYAHELYGSRPPSRTATDRRLRATGRLLRTIPAVLRWQLPPGHILKAVGRLGPGSHPSARRLRDSAAGMP
jgi:hypothetical protein